MMKWEGVAIVEMMIEERKCILNHHSCLVAIINVKNFKKHLIQFSSTYEIFKAGFDKMSRTIQA